MERKLRTTQRERGPTEDVRPGFLTECWKIPAWSWAHDGAVGGGVAGRQTTPKTLVPLHSLPDWLCMTGFCPRTQVERMDVHGKWLMCLGVGTGVQEPSSDFGFGGQSRAVPQVTGGNKTGTEKGK